MQKILILELQKTPNLINRSKYYYIYKNSVAIYLKSLFKQLFYKFKIRKKRGNEYDCW